MPLSASTLIHFTRDKNALKGILSDNFQVFNCRESLTLKNAAPVIYYVPMVSFCDIPLSEVKSHIAKYGAYGIGLTKEWGMKKGLNPVLYMAKGSSLSDSFERAFLHFATTERGGGWKPEQKSLADLLRYMKNYEGDLTRKGTILEKYRFSDEREWRYVPPADADCRMMCSVADYNDAAVRSDIEAKLKHLRLKFEPNDIKYIVIREDDEIGEFVDHLRKAKGQKYTLGDVERLTTRILTAQQINDDM